MPDDSQNQSTSNSDQNTPDTGSVINPMNQTPPPVTGQPIPSPQTQSNPISNNSTPSQTSSPSDNGKSTNSVNDAQIMQGSLHPDSKRGFSQNMVTSPPKRSGKKVIATIFGILVLIGGVAAGVYLVRRQQLLQRRAANETGQIAIFKYMCDQIGQQDVCNGRDTGLNDYKIDYTVHAGDNDQGPVVQTITVKLSDNDQGHGNTGDGSQGRKEGDSLSIGTYTVCEIPIAYNDSGDQVPLEVEPRPTASQGGSSGGSRQDQFGDKCIKVELTPGTAELKYLNKRSNPPIPTTTPSPSPTSKPGFTPTPKPPTSTPIPSPTLPPNITAECLDVKVYDEDWNLISISDLTKLKAGDKVKFAVEGSASSGFFDKARFTVNSTQQPETTDKKPGTQEFYIEYEIPTGTTSFSVDAQVHHSTLGWI